MLPSKYMSSFRSLTADREPLEEFKRRASQFETKRLDATSTDLALNLYEWSDSTAYGVEKRGLESAQGFDSKSEGVIRVM